MAHDGYSRTNDPPPSYDHVDPHLQNAQSYYANDGYKSSSRHNSRDRGELKPPQEQPYGQQPRRPIAEALNTAFDNAHVNGISQDVMAQITQNVIEQLKKSGTLGTGQAPPAQAHQQPPPTPQHPPPQQQYYPPPPSSPSNHSGGASPSLQQRNVYTPPSPHKHTEQHPGSPDSTASGPHHATVSPHRAPEEKRRPSDGSDRSDTKNNRPKAAERQPSNAEETTLEKIWGTLFNEDGKPTQRLSQFLRGLANHLVSSLSCTKSLRLRIIDRRL